MEISPKEAKADLRTNTPLLYFGVTNKTMNEVLEFSYGFSFFFRTVFQNGHGSKEVSDMCHENIILISYVTAQLNLNSLSLELGVTR